MKPAIWSSYLIDHTPEDVVAVFATRGWQHLELSDEHGLALLERGDPEASGRAFRARAADRGVALPQGHLYLRADITAADGGARWLDLYAAVLHPTGVPAATRRTSSAPWMII